jgi:purine-nucleoside phosphorylase
VTHSPVRTAPTAFVNIAEQAAEAAELIRSRGALAPRVGLILGSGLGDLADDVESPVVVPYSEIPHFPVSTVVGHAGQLVVGMLRGVAVAVMRGRVHYYEGYSVHEVTFPVRVMRRLGADTLIVTNAAGGLNESFHTGDLMLLTDHLNIMGMAGQSPLLGPNDETLGPRFLDMLHAYDADLRRLAHQAAAQSGFQAREGVYAMVGGPAFETMAEIRFLQTAGADAVGMSTIPEVIVARHGGMRVLGISAITDMAVGPGAVSEISHIEVLAAAEEIRPRLAAVVRGVLAGLAT